MRHACAFMLLVLLAAPLAAADARDAPSITVTPFDGAIQPLEEVASTTVTVRMGCDLLPENETVTFPLTVTDAPPWANVTLAPGTLEASRDACGEDETWTETATLIAKVGADAPAFHPERVTVQMQVALPNLTMEPSTSVPLEAGFYGILDVQVPESNKLGEPQSVLSYPITVTNHGNGPVRVSWRVDDAPEGFMVPVPQPVTLQSALTGNGSSAVVPVSVMTPYRNGYLNEIGSIALVLESAYALDASIEGDSSSVSLLATAKGWYVPGPAPLVGVLAVAGVALALRRHR